jgi:SAM-dependent methyltransferase
VEQYDDFAETYPWLFNDEMLTGEPFLASYEDVLARLAAGARVLDCACGIGVEAIALARRGFAVTGTDISSGMIAQARRRGGDAGVDVHWETCAWDELPEHVEPGFDLVVCKGNSLVHAGGQSATVAALKAMFQMLRPGGELVIGTRNFEHLRAQRPHIELWPVRVQRDGVTCATVYVWQIPESWDAPHVSDLVFIFDAGATVSHRVHRIGFVPYRSDELLAWLGAAGFADVRSDRTDDVARYTVTARRP